MNFNTNRKLIDKPDVADDRKDILTPVGNESKQSQDININFPVIGNDDRRQTIVGANKKDESNDTMEYVGVV